MKKDIQSINLDNEDGIKTCNEKPIDGVVRTGYIVSAVLIITLLIFSWYQLNQQSFGNGMQTILIFIKYFKFYRQGHDHDTALHRQYEPMRVLFVVSGHPTPSIHNSFIW